MHFVPALWRWTRWLAPLAVALGCDGAPMAGPNRVTTPTGTIAVRSISVSLDSSLLVVGHTEGAVAVARDASGAPLGSVNVTWSSGNNSIATVSPTGVVSAVGPGNTVILATAGGFSGGTALTVAPPDPTVASIVVKLDSAAAPGASLQATATVVASDGASVADLPITWYSSDPSIAAVSSTGMVTAFAPGSVTINAVAGGQRGIATLNVRSLATGTIMVGITLTSVVTLGQTAQAVSTVRDANGNLMAGQSVTWSSGSPNIATISAAGVVTPVATGTTVITAAALGQSSSVRLTVTDGTVASVLVSMASTKLTTGQTGQASALVRDANGATLSNAPVAWSSSNSAVATVSPSGLVTGVATGTASILGSSGGYSGNVTVSVSGTATGPAPSLVIVSLANSSITVKGTTQATAVVKDASGAVISNAAVSWSSSDPAIASVSPTGLVTAVSAGAASINATAGSVVGGSAVTVTAAAVTPTIATIGVTLATGTMNVGQTAQATAIARDASGAIVSATFAWTSSNPAAATVSSTTGLIAAVGTGTATITAASGSISGTVSVTVQAAVPPPTGGTHIPLLVTRFVAGGGPVLVSNAIPLTPGLLFAGNTRNVRVYVGGVEQSIYTEVLQGTHPDGSLRSLLIQFTTAVDSGHPLAGELVVGSPRGTTDIAKPTNGRGVPLAVALPTDPNYLVATNIVGPTLTSAQTAPLGADYVRYDADFKTYSDRLIYQVEGDDGCYNYYDRAVAYYAQWVRTGDPEYWRRGTKCAHTYRVGYLEAVNYGSSAHWSLMESLDAHYTLTGDDSSRYAVSKVIYTGVGGAYQYLDIHADSVTNSFPQGYDDRIRARAILVILEAWRLNAEPALESMRAAQLDTALNRIIASETVDGEDHFPDFCNLTFNYMQGMLNDALIKYYMYYKADPRILPYVKRSVDYLWTQWSPTARAFSYMPGTCNPPSGDGGDATPATDLNNLITDGFAWVYSQTHDPVYRDRADQSFLASVEQAGIAGEKQFNQEYYSAYLYFAFRR